MRIKVNIKGVLDMKWFKLPIIALPFIFASVSSVQAQAVQNWTLGDIDAPAHWGPTAARQFADTVDKATAGRVKVTVYPAESLFKGKDSLDAVSKNLTQMYRVGGMHAAGELRILELMDIPMFVPADYDFRNKLWDALTPLYRDLLKKRYGVHLAGILAAEPRMIYTKKSFPNLAGLKGRKIRTAGPVETDFTRALGMAPTTVASSEIYTALQQEVVDGNWVADAPQFYMKCYEVTKYIYDIGAGGFSFYVLANQKALDTLAEADRTAVTGALSTYVKDLREGSRGGFVNGRQWLIDKGMLVVPVSAEDRATMQKAADEILQKWVKQLDPEQMKIYEVARKMVDEYNAAKK